MKSFSRLFILLFFTLSVGSPVIAQEIDMIAPLPAQAGMPPIDAGIGQLFGQNHWYSVVLRGNGEAVVNTRITLTNSNTNPMKSVAFRVPRVEPQDAVAFQVIQQGPDFYSYYGPAKYQRAALDFSGDTMTITLPQSIASNASGSILLYYRAFGYAKKDLVGGYHFTFDTLQATDPIQKLQVGISTDTELFLRGTKSQVNYRFEDLTLSSKGMMAEAAPAVNSRMDSYYQQIGYGDLVKTTSNLQALESFTVKGAYADNKLKLYTKEIGIGVGIIILIVAVGFILVRRIIQTNRSSTQQSTNVLAVFGLSFLSAIITVGYSAALMYIVQNTPQLFGYQAQAPIMLLILVISLGVYGLLLGAPPLFIGIKRGVWYGLATAGMTVLWLILTLFIYLIMNASGQNPGPYPMGIMKTLDSSVGSVPEAQ